MSTSTYDSRGPVSTTVDTVASMGGGAHVHRRISWGAVFGGVIIVVAMQLLLSLLGFTGLLGLGTPLGGQCALFGAGLHSRIVCARLGAKLVEDVLPRLQGRFLAVGKTRFLEATHRGSLLLSVR